MSESCVIEESLLNEENAEQVTEISETAFSRFGAAPRRSYGYSATMTKDTASPLGSALKSKDLLDVEMSQEDYSESLFDMNDEAPSTNACLMNSDNEDEDNDNGTNKKRVDSEEESNGEESSDEDEEPQQEAPAKHGRTKKSFRSVLETTGETLTQDNDAVDDAPAANQVHDDSSDDEEDVDEDVTVEFPASDEMVKDVEETTTTKISEEKSSDYVSRPFASTESAEVKTIINIETLEIGSTTTEMPEEEKRQPDKDSLITSIDNLFVHADKQTVTVRDVVRSLEAEYDIKFEKPTKQMIKAHLVALVKGHVEPTVEPEGPRSESDEEEKEASDAGEDFDSDSSEEEEEVKKPPKKKRNKKPTKRVSPRQKPSKKKPSHVRIHAEMLRKRRIEELRVRNEELQVKQSKEDQKRAEQIAAKFETDTDELRLKRLEDRLDLLQKLDQKRIRVISDEARSETKVEKVEDVASATNDAQASSCAPTEDSDNSDDEFELEIVGKNESLNDAAPKTLLNVPPPGASIITKSSALSMLDMVGSLKPSDKKNMKRTGVIFLSADQPQASPGKSMSARAALRNSLRAKQRKGANMWLARELGYKTEEEHMRDCMLVEQKKREDVVKREEERLKANERRQLRERMLMENNAYEEVDEEEEYNPNDADEPSNGAGDGNESDEEMAMARQIEEEQRIEGSTEESLDGEAAFDEDHSTDPPIDKDQESPQLEQDVDESKVGHERELIPSVDDVAPTDADNNESPGLVSKPVEATPKEVDTDDDSSDSTMTADETMEAEPTQSGGTSQNEDAFVFLQECESPVGDKSETSATPKSADSEEEQPSISDAVQDEDANVFEQTSDVEQGDDEADEKEKEAPKDRNAGWKAMLQKEAEKFKRQKARKNGKDLVEAEADEEEEEEVAGLEDFGFSLGKKKKDDDDAEEADADKFTEEDLKHVVDDVSDDEGDEEAGAAARKELEQREEKERHKEIIRRMREGYDGRRGGIAGAGVGARGMHRFDQLVAADNREDAKRLGLLNDDELDSDDEAKGDGNGDDEEDDENALLDKMLKDRFLHRSSVEEVEENFSSDEEQEEVNEDKEENADDDDDDEKEQERLAKRFTRRARLQRCIETHGNDEEFSQLRLIDEDKTTKLELKMMKSVSRKSRETSTGSSSRSASQSSDSREGPPVFGVTTKRSSSLALGTSSLSLALQASRVSKKKKTSFLGGTGASKEMSCSIHKCVSMGHVVFNTGGDSQLSKGGQTSRSSNLASSNQGKRKRAKQSTSLWSKVSANGFKRRRS